MASYESEALFDLVANELTNRTLEVRIHSGAPGADGTANRIGTFAQDVTASGWTAAASGSVSTTGAQSFGVLSTLQSVTVAAYTVFFGTTFLWGGDVYPDGADKSDPNNIGVEVEANEEFELSAGEVGIGFSS